MLQNCFLNFVLCHSFNWDGSIFWILSLSMAFVLHVNYDFSLISNLMLKKMSSWHTPENSKCLCSYSGGKKIMMGISFIICCYYIGEQSNNIVFHLNNLKLLSQTRRRIVNPIVCNRLVTLYHSLSWYLCLNIWMEHNIRVLLLMIMSSGAPKFKSL